MSVSHTLGSWPSNTTLENCTFSEVYFANQIVSVSAPENGMVMFKNCTWKQCSNFPDLIRTSLLAIVSGGKNAIFEDCTFENNIAALLTEMVMNVTFNKCKAHYNSGHTLVSVMDGNLTLVDSVFMNTVASTGCM